MLLCIKCSSEFSRHINVLNSHKNPVGGVTRLTSFLKTKGLNPRGPGSHKQEKRPAQELNPGCLASVIIIHTSLWWVAMNIQPKKKKKMAIKMGICYELGTSRDMSCNSCSLSFHGHLTRIDAEHSRAVMETPCTKLHTCPHQKCSCNYFFRITDGLRQDFCDRYLKLEYSE